MEDGLVLKVNVKFANGNGSLNPCCNGRWSSTMCRTQRNTKKVCLNPCCNGRWSSTGDLNLRQVSMGGLNPCCNGRWSSTYY